MTSKREVLAGRRVLIVEDRYLIASELVSEVRRLGGAVAGPAPDVKAATDLLGAAPVDLALLDVNLDGEQVFPVAEVLVERGTPFIFVTGYSDWEWPARWADRPRLCKPISSRLLESHLAKLLGGT